MARITCICGETMWNGMVPNDIEYHVFSDRRAAEIDERDAIDTVELWGLRTYNVWRCPACGRLFVFEPDSGSAVAVYRREDAGAGE